MAEAAVEEDVTLPTKEEIGEEQEGQEAPQLTEQEQRAYEKGWRPEAEYEGDDWIDAKEFNGRAPLYEGLSKQGKEIKEMKGVVKTMAEQLKKADEAALAKAKRQLKAERVQAHRDEDYDKVVELEDKQRELDQQQQVNTQAEQQEDFVDWHAKNEWYGKKDDEGNASDATVFADAYGLKLREQNPEMSPADLFAEVEAHVKKVMPQEFGKPLPNRGAAVGSQAGGRGKQQAATYAMLNSDQKAVCRQLVQTGVFTQAEYVKQLDELGEVDKG